MEPPAGRSSKPSASAAFAGVEPAKKGVFIGIHIYTNPHIYTHINAYINICAYTYTYRCICGLRGCQAYAHVHLYIYKYLFST